MANQKRPFNTKAFVAMMAGITGLILPVSGLILHSLRGRRFFAARHAWLAIHAFFGILFLLFTCRHIYLNRRSFIHYLKSGANDSAPLSREAICAVIVTAAILFMMIHTF